MYLSFKESNGARYATVMNSIRKDGKMIKDKVRYLGKVVDLDKMIFQNRAYGTYCYDIEADEITHIKDLSLIPPPVLKPMYKMNLDYGDTTVIETVMKGMGMDRCISALGSGNDDTIFALVEYCICVSDIGRYEAATWYEGNQIRLSHPKADLRSQRISDAIEVIGDLDSHTRFFKEYLPIVTGNKPLMAAIDSKGVVNAIDTEMTQASNHNGKVSVEVRLIAVVELGTGRPIYFRTVPGNVVDSLTLIQTIERLEALKVKIEFTVVDAGYCTLKNMKQLKNKWVNFITRLKPNFKLYGQLFQDYGSELEKKENVHTYHGRIVYVKRVECDLDEGVPGYAYLILDTKKRHTEMTDAAIRFEKNQISPSELNEIIEKAGRFIIVSSFIIDPQDILSNYYLRQSAEQYFDLINGYASLSPIAVHDNVKMNGAIMLSFIASAVLREMQLTLKDTGIPVRNALLALRNQKCLVYDEYILIDEVCGKSSTVYDAFGIEKRGFRYLSEGTYLN